MECTLDGESKKPPEGGSGGGGGGESKSKRKMKTPMQLELLEKTYALEAYPSEAIRQELSVKLDLTDRQLQMWFCHRRLKDRKVPPEKKPRKDNMQLRASTSGQGLDDDMMMVSGDRGNDHGSGSGSGSSQYEHRKDGGSGGRSTVSRGGADSTMVMAKRYHEPPQAISELRAIAFVESQLGEALREDGPILGMKFDPLPPGAFGAPIDMRNMQRIVYENETLMRELETHRRELQQQRKKIEKREAQLDLKSKQLSVLNEEVTRKLNIVQGNLEGAKDMSRGGNVQAQIEVDDMCKNLEEKDYELDSLINLNNALIAKECRSNHELQEARKVLIEGLDGFATARSRPAIGIKRMGELNDKPFRDICIKKFPATEWETKYVELCSLWQNKIQDSEWYPYKHVTIDKKLHEVINEDDEKLRELKDECGREVYDAVATASLEMNQYNASGRYPVRELWNFKEGRQASLKEVMEYVLQKLKALKGVKRR